MSMKNADMPAMPTWELNGKGDPEMTGEGCTKREYFAGLAMQSVIAAKHEEIKWWTDEVKHQSFAQAAVSYADALLAELEKEAQS